MAASHTRHACKGLFTSLQSSASSNARSNSRAIFSENAHRSFSRTSIVSAVGRTPYRAASTATATATKPASTATSYKPTTPASRPAPTTSAPPKPTTPNTPTRPSTTAPSKPTTTSYTTGLADEPIPPTPTAVPLDSTGNNVDWSSSFHGLSFEPFSEKAQEILQSPISALDVEVKPDGIIYLPEIKYRRILNKAFGPGGWGLAPRGETIVTPKSVTREYGLVAHGRLVSIARGEQQYFDPEGIPTATEGCKSNALMRCCKDLGIASELWDPVFIRAYLAKHAKEVWVEHVTTKRKKKITMRKDVSKIPYPYKESSPGGA